MNDGFYTVDISKKNHQTEILENPIQTSQSEIVPQKMTNHTCPSNLESISWLRATHELEHPLWFWPTPGDGLKMAIHGCSRKDVHSPLYRRKFGS